MPELPPDIGGLLEFLRAAERLKCVHRSAWTSDGMPESAAAHTWRLTLMAMVFAHHFPDVDTARLIRICIVHDLGEALGGDIPAPEQDAASPKAAEEREALVRLTEPLSARVRDEIVGLWDEYERAETPEARVAKALDKLETILQHNQGRNPPTFDYRFNLDYGRKFTDQVPLLAAVRAVLDAETEEKARGTEGPGAT